MLFPERAIRLKAAKDAKLEDDDRLSKAVSDVYKAWPSVAREIGSYSSPENQTKFIAKLYTLTKLRGAYLQGIANAIRDLYGNGELPASFYDPGQNAVLTSAAKAEDAQKAVENPSFFDKVTGGITGTVDTVKKYGIWVLIGLGIIAAVAGFLWLKTATAPMRMGLKTAKGLLGGGSKVKENPIENVEYEEIE